MRRALKIKDPDGLYFAFTVVYWIDLFTLLFRVYPLNGTPIPKIAKYIKLT